MAMDFFGHQDAARKRTTLLVVLFALAVIAILFLTYLATATFVLFMRARDEGFQDGVGSLFEPWLLLIVSAIVLTVVGGASLIRLALLKSGGGKAVAEMLGGRRVDHNTNDPQVRTLINIVEEMAIASGVPCPPVYLMESETAINAFAAGWSTDDAVIGVTRGAVTKLSRDELQGVIAHEYSHILNGDMRLNIRLIGILNGILIIGLAGYGVLRSMRYAAYGAGSSRSGKRGDGGAGILAILAFGVALLIIGYAGVFFGRIIKAAVSRQREYLADAAAVQFTRNPDGIGSALQKIGGYSRQGVLQHARADEASHMYFAEGVPLMLTFLFATHPPLDDRIKRVLPSWDGKFPKVFDREPIPETPLERMRSARTKSVDSPAASGLINTGMAGMMMASIGQPTADHLNYAEQLINELPKMLRDAAHETYSARALVFALLLDRADDRVRNRQWAILNEHHDRELLSVVRKLSVELDRLDERIRLPLIDLSLSSLQEMSKEQYREFTAVVQQLAEADESISLFEWVLRRIILRHLKPHFEPQPRKVAQFYKLRLLRRDLEIVLSTLAFNGAADREGATRAFVAATRELRELELRLLSETEAARASLDQALDRLALATPKLKRDIVAACVACICVDARVTIREGELLRAFCDAMLVPVPPLLPGQTVTTSTRPTAVGWQS